MSLDKVQQLNKVTEQKQQLLKEYESLKNQYVLKEQDLNKIKVNINNYLALIKSRKHNITQQQFQKQINIFSSELEQISKEAEDIKLQIQDIEGSIKVKEKEALLIVKTMLEKKED